MSIGPPPSAVQDLQVGDTVKAAYASVFGRFATLIRAALVPLVISFLLYGLQLAARGSPALVVLADLLLLLPYTLFAVTWHRVVLLGPAAMPAQMTPVWQRRHWRFLGYTLIVTAISYGFSLLYGPLIVPLITGSSAISLWQALLLMFMLLLATYVILRLSFVFPAVAVDEGYGFAEAWRHTKDQGLRLMAAMFLTLIPAMLGILVILQFLLTIASAVSGAADPSALGPVAQVIDLVLRYVIIALSLSVISIAFKVCTGWVADVRGPPVGPLAGGPDDGQDT
jgi:hypothetical protein